MTNSCYNPPPMHPLKPGDIIEYRRVVDMSGKELVHLWDKAWFLGFSVWGDAKGIGPVALVQTERGQVKPVRLDEIRVTGTT